MLVKKLIYLTICSVPDKEIRSLLGKEKKLLELLKVDSLHQEELWFESMCTMMSGPNRLLLTGHDLGHPVDCQSIQTGLDFSEREKELFESHEMGASALRELKRYSAVHDKVRERLRRETPAVNHALKWALSFMK